MSYTTSKAPPGLGVQFQVNSTGSTYIPVYECTEFSQSGKTTKTVSVTNLNSTVEEFIGTISSGGTYQLTMNRISTDPGQQALAAAFNTKALTNFKIQMPLAIGQTTTGDLFSFAALVETFEDLSSVKPDGAVMTKCSLKVSAAITLTEGS